MSSNKFKKQKINSDEDKLHDGSLHLAQALTVLTSGNVNQLTTQQKATWLTCIESVSHQCGLSEEELIALVDVIGNQIFVSSVNKRLVSCLISSDAVPEDAVIKAISWMTIKTFPTAMQVCFMKWICSVYDRLKEKETISYCYSILFEFLRNNSLCPYVCELLCKMTKKEHVTSYRMKCLLQTESRMGAQSYILTLIKLYADHRPNLLCLINSKIKNTLKFFDTLAQVAPSSTDTDSNNSPSEADEAKYNNVCKEIENLNDSNGNSGVLKLYNSPIRRQLLTSNLSDNLLYAFRIFLQSGLYTDRNNHSSLLPHNSKGELLKVLSELTIELQEGIPEVLTFLGFYLNSWDGYANRNAVFDLIEHWELCPYDDLWYTVLKPLFDLFYVSDILFMCSMIQCLTNLYSYWALFELPRYFERTGTHSSMSVVYKTMSIFHKDQEIENPENQIELLSVFINKLCIIALLRNPENQALVVHSALKFYETVLTVNASNRSILLLVPSLPMLTTLVFSKNSLFLSEICGLVCRYKDAVYAIKDSNNENNFIVPSLALVNDCIIDICKVLGLCAAFKPSEKSIFFRSKIPDRIKMSCAETHEAFSIYRHPALLGCVSHFQRIQEEEITPYMLLKASTARNSYFEYLSSMGFSNIPLFLRTFIKGMV